MSLPSNQSPSRLETLPTEIKLHIFHACADILHICEMLELCLVNKGFYQLGMEAIFESDILQHVVYWDPVRETKVFRKELPDDRYTSPGAYIRSVFWELFTDPKYHDFMLSNEFCIRYLTARTLGKIRQKPPTKDHIVLKAIAEHMKQYKLGHDASCNTTIEEEVQVVCEIAVKHGYIRDRHDFFTGKLQLDENIAFTCLDETCPIVREGLVAVAIYIDEPEILRTIIAKQQSITCPDHVGDDENHGRTSDIELPRADRSWLNYIHGLDSLVCERSLIRIANTTRMMIQTDNMNCATILLDSLAVDSGAKDVVRYEIISESKTLERLKWLTFAISCGPSLTRYNTVRPGLQVELDWLGRTKYSSRKPAAIELSKILDKTTSVDVFDVVYDAIIEGFTEREGVWWTKTSYRDDYAAHTLASWGTARIHRAVLDNCMPLVKRLVGLGYHLRPSHSAEDLEDYNVCTLVESEKPRDISLPLATSRGDLEMVKLLFDIGAEMNRKNVRKAIKIAMEQNNGVMLEILVKKGYPEGLLNRRHMRLWKKDLEKRGQQYMLPWLEMMRRK
ncbi:hypothetical protein FPOA_02299 [Fusarium poae]|uniref:Uncharacterized protein n=1 Tax=Fusarium poae TaxID=36050 RepID=A0A1B8B6K3_FUSPO|nr:hypothetical protein FPOA_02299 [Fusarium poae]